MSSANSKSTLTCTSLPFMRYSISALSLVTIESVATILVKSEAATRSGAGPEKIPCVTKAYTSLAPFSLSSVEALQSVPAVSVMSSMMMHVLLETSPITVV